jgi:hypothetical protein
MLRVTSLRSGSAKFLARKTAGVFGNAAPVAAVVRPRIDFAQRSFSNNDGMKAMLDRLKKKKSESTEAAAPAVEINPKVTPKESFFANPPAFLASKRRGNT